MILTDVVSETDLMRKYKLIESDVLTWTTANVIAHLILLFLYLLYTVRFAFTYARRIEVPLN